MKTALIVRHVAFEDLGTLEPVLVDSGYNLDFREAGWHDLSGIDPLAPDILIVLGGPIGVYDQNAYPFLRDEIALLEHRLRQNLPTLGICLGAQLMAAALGASVYPGANGKEIGWSPLHPGTDANSYPCLQPLFGDGVEVLHWHGDTFDLPAGTTHLAATPRYPHQAFACGTTALALQFHPEVTAQGLERWYIGHAAELGAIPSADIAGLRAASERKGPVLERAACRFWAQWLATIS